jgi:hypothetical protein
VSGTKEVGLNDLALDARATLRERLAELVSSAIEKQDPVAYGYLQGKFGGRAGTGLMVMLGSTFSLLFRLVSDIFLFAGLVMLRLLVILFPAVAVLGVMAPMAAVVRRVFSMGGAGVINVIAFAAGSAVHTTVISAILSRAGTTGMGVLAIVLCLVVTAAAFIVLYPLLSFTTILGHSGAGQRVLQRGGREVWNYALRREATKDGVAAANVAATTKTHADASADEPPPRRDVRHSHLPAEAFARPAPLALPQASQANRSVEVPPRPPVAALAGPHPEHLATAPLTWAATMTTLGAQPAEPAMHADRPDPAYALAAAATPTGSRDAMPPAGGDVLSGVLVDEVPENARQLPTLAHDSQTQIRRDGIGPRLYDPDTKQTVLTVQKRAEE